MVRKHVLLSLPFYRENQLILLCHSLYKTEFSLLTVLKMKKRSLLDAKDDL